MTVRICFFGDSFVAGVGDPTGLGWVGRVTAAARTAGRDVTAYPLGIRRDTSVDVAARWEEEAARRLPTGEPARLLFAFGANDACPGADGAPRVDAATSLDTARAILTRARAIAPTLMIGPLPVLDDAATDGRAAALSSALGRLCGTLDVAYLPVFEVVAASAAWRAEAAAGDGTHPGAGGYAELAEHLLDRSAFRDWLGLPAGAAFG